MCLRCRAEARAAARRERYRALARLSAITLGGGASIALIVGGLFAVVPRSKSTAPSLDAPSRATPVVKQQASRAPAPVARVPRPEVVAPVVSNPAPSAVEGRTYLADSVYVEHTGAEVVVHFDNSKLRTRFEEKFERTVRATLPKALGAEAAAALDAVREGTFVRGGSLLGNLPKRGIAIGTPSGDTLRVWPVTRSGDTGPIVVAYRATITK